MDELIREIIEAKEKNDIETFSKKLYQYYEENYFDTKALEDIAIKMDLKGTSLNTYIDKYVTEKLNMTSNKFYEYKRKIREFKKSITLDVDNPILKELEIITKLLYRNDKEKELVLKRMFLDAKNNNFNSEFVNKTLKDFNLSYYRYFNILEEAAVVYFNMSEEEYKTLIFEKSENNRKFHSIQRKINNVRLKTVYDNLLQADTIEEIEKVIIDSKYEFANVANNFRSYEMFYNTGEIYIILKNIERYKKYKSDIVKNNRDEIKNQKLQEDLNEIEELINEFLICDINSIDEYLSLKEVDSSRFKRLIKILQDNNDELYNKYINKIEILEKNEEDKKLKIIESIINKLNTNIIENDVEREFDLLDIMISLNGIPFKEIMNVCKKLNDRKYTTLSSLLNKSHGAEIENTHYKNIIMSEKRIIGVQKDEKGNFIENSGRELTTEEKEKIILFLEKYNIPLNSKTFNLALKRYLKGVLFIPKDNKTLNIGSI